MDIRTLDIEHRGEVDRYIREEWGGPMMVSLGKLFDSRELPGFVALDGEVLLGAALYHTDGSQCEIACLFSFIPGRGAGGALIDAVAAHARGAGCKRVWLITTNDNTQAIRFYQMCGFSLCAVHIGSLEAARKLKPGLPKIGNDGIPLEHEFEFEVML